MKIKYFICLFLSLLFIFWLFDKQADAADPVGDATVPDGIAAAAPDAGTADPAEDADGSEGDTTAAPDVPPGINFDFLQPTLDQYQVDSARRQADSELFRFALVAFLAVWASKTITQRRRF